MTLPGFNQTREIAWKFHVTENLLNYNIIIGWDLLKELGITIDFSNDSMTWEEATVKMQPTDTPVIQLTSYSIENDEDDTVKRINNTKYVKADLK